MAWRGDKLRAAKPSARIEAVVTVPKLSRDLRYSLEFTESRSRIEVTNERVEDASTQGVARKRSVYFGYEDGHPTLNGSGNKTRRLELSDVDPSKSILAQRSDSERYPELTSLASRFRQIRLFRSWAFGRNASGRDPKSADDPNDILDDGEAAKAPFGGNIAILLSRLLLDSTVHAGVLEHLREIYAEIDDIRILTEAGGVQVFVIERGVSFPAMRLSDGTLRYLCLLAIFCNPRLPPLVCIDEPELGLHPDAMGAVAKLLKEASLRTQVIVSTHSRVIVDALSQSPEDVVICEKVDGCTQMTRLVAKDLKVWVDKYSLGELWTRGELGGNRW